MTAIWGLSDLDMIDRLCAVFAAEQRLALRRLELVREADGRGLAKRDGATSMVAWLRDKLRVSPYAARRMVVLARALDSASGVAEAMRAGEVNEEQAAVIAASVSELAGRIEPDVVVKAEERLIGDAAVFEPLSLRRLAARILDHVAPELAEEKLRKDLEAAEKRAQRDRAFTLTPAGLGLVRVSGLLDAEAAAIVAAALDPLCAPGRVWAHGSTADPSPAPSAAASSAAAGTGPLGFPATDPAAGSTGVAGAGSAGGSAERDSRTAAQRRADALVDICRYTLAAGELPDNGGDRPQVVITFGFDDLVQRTGAAALDNGSLLSPETVRRAACDAAIIPAVLGSTGQVLDLGRERRLFTGPVRRALVLRDKGCAFPGCDRPARWCDGHHCVHWADGGPTCLSNAVLLCGHHHRLVHHSDWTVTVAADGLPEFIPPAYIDPTRTPRRNTYWTPT